MPSSVQLRSSRPTTAADYDIAVTAGEKTSAPMPFFAAHSRATITSSRIRLMPSPDLVH
jgi:hypothetical protein